MPATSTPITETGQTTGHTASEGKNFHISAVKEDAIKPKLLELQKWRQRLSGMKDVQRLPR